MGAVQIRYNSWFISLPYSTKPPGPYAVMQALISHVNNDCSTRDFSWHSLI